MLLFTKIRKMTKPKPAAAAEEVVEVEVVEDIVVEEDIDFE